MSINTSDIKDVLALNTLFAAAKVPVSEELIVALIDWKRQGQQGNPPVPVTGRHDG
jgi:hypothetical protein